MNRLILTAICLLVFLSASAQEKKVLRGFDGGMMVHTGYLTGNLNAIDYTAKGAPMGIGCDFIVSGPMHLTLKVDYLCALSESKLLPHGPRIFFGFLFYH